MDIIEIKRIFELVCRVNCESYATIAEVAREMGVKKTALMQFVLDNPKLFNVIEWNKRTSKNTVKNLGLAFRTVYLSADQNPETDEWLQKMQTVWNKKLHVGEQSYYNQHEYFFIPEDTKSNNNKYWLYRNTPEKIQALVDMGILEKTKTGYGGLGDYYQTEVFLYNNDLEKKLRSAGWTTDFKP